MDNKQKWFYQFFPTPSIIADVMVQEIKPKENELVCEPSAGDGAIVKAIQRYLPEKQVYVFEKNQENVEKLLAIKDVFFCGYDFLKSDLKFDVIIANPPYMKGLDILHLEKMIKSLNKGGRLITLVSPSFKSKKTKEADFVRDIFKKAIVIPLSPQDIELFSVKCDILKIIYYADL